MKVDPQLRVFVQNMINMKVDYATAFARACGPFFSLENLEEQFDAAWDRYEVRTL